MLWTEPGDAPRPDRDYQPAGARHRAQEDLNANGHLASPPEARRFDAIHSSNVAAVRRVPSPVDDGLA